MQTETREVAKAKRRRVSGRKTREKQRAAPIPLEDLGPIERWRHRFGVERLDEAGQVRREVVRALEVEPRLLEAGVRSRQGQGARHVAENPLDLLYRRGLLGDVRDPEGKALAERRRRAGHRLRAWHGRAGAGGRTTANLAAVGGGGGWRGADSQTDEEARAEKVYHRMLDAAGRSWGLLRDVCCDLRHPADNAVEIGRLVAGLDRLAAYLRLRDDDDEGRPEPPAGDGR
jgi:hypothetical protein